MLAYAVCRLQVILRMCVLAAAISVPQAGSALATSCVGLDLAQPMPSGGRYFTRYDKGWSHRHRRGGAYDKGATAWECLDRDSYAFLKQTHHKHLDEWPRLRLISFCVTLLCRHGRTNEPGHKAKIDSKGTMSVSEFMKFRMVRCLETTEQDIEDMVRAQTKDRLVVIRDSRGMVARLGCRSLGRRLSRRRNLLKVGIRF